MRGYGGRSVDRTWSKPDDRVAYEKRDIKLLKKCKEFYPEAENADAYLGRTYYMIGNLKKAEEYNDYALDSNPKNEFAKQTKVLIENKKNNAKQ